MEIADLPPDIHFDLLPSTTEAIDFAFEAKRAALGPHIERRWGWDEAFQRELHQRRYVEKPFYRIVKSASAIGTVSLHILANHMRFGEFYLLPRFQRQGVGTTILRHCLYVADNLGIATRLEYLHWNPVGSLYEREGFKEVGRSEIHIFMERPPRLTKS